MRWRFHWTFKGTSVLHGSSMFFFGLWSDVEGFHVMTKRNCLHGLTASMCCAREAGLDHLHAHGEGRLQSPIQGVRVAPRHMVRTAERSA